MDGGDLAGVRAVADEVVLGLLGDEPAVGYLDPIAAVEGDLNGDLNLTVQDRATHSLTAGRVRHRQSWSLTPRGSDRHL